MTNPAENSHSLIIKYVDTWRILYRSHGSGVNYNRYTNFLADLIYKYIASYIMKYGYFPTQIHNVKWLDSTIISINFDEISKFINN